MFKVGIDIGGTFTDLYGSRDGETFAGKSLTTPEDLSKGILDAAERANVDLHEVDYLVHSSTIATNSLLQRNYYGWWPVGCLITTDGFRDSLEIGRYNRRDMYDLYQEDIVPLIPRRLRFTLPETSNARGVVTEAVDVEATRQLATRLKELKVESVGITFINSYINPENELKAKQILQEELGASVPIITSSEICPKFRELGRMNTVAVHTLLKPIVSRYLARLQEVLAENGFTGKLLMVKDDGGIVSAETMKEFPAFMLSSGPAAGVHSGVAYAQQKGKMTEGDLGAGDLGAGVVAGQAFARAKGLQNVLTQDMGGTSYDVSIIEGGHILLTTTGEVDVDQPIVLPMIDVRAIGAGGGSILWIDRGGSLRVGPQSAGAHPGPACYGFGGTEPTVTDANLVLGRCPDTLGGRLKLDKQAAERAMMKIAKPMGMTAVEAADAAIEILCANIYMADSLVTTSRGRDPRDFVPLVYGGAGGMHICLVAEKLGLDKALMVFQPGVYSAVGATTMPFKMYAEKTLHTDIGPSTDVEAIQKVHQELVERVTDVLVNDEGAVKEEIEYRFFGELRYIGQTYEVMVEMPDPSHPDFIAEVQRRFHEAHQKEYFISSPGLAVSLVDLRVDGFWRSEIGDIPTYPPATTAIGTAKTSVKKAYFGGELVDTAVYDFAALQPGHEVAGPAVIEQEHATLVLFPGWTGTVDQFRGVDLRRVQPPHEKPRASTDT